VESNVRLDGTGGAYWRLRTLPEYGNLSIGVNFFAMHYSHNEQAFTYGMGGYFSPVAYFLANVPFTWVGHSGTRWHYNVMGSLGVQAFQQDLARLFPLASQESLEVSSGNLALPAMTSVLWTLIACIALVCLAPHYLRQCLPHLHHIAHSLMSRSLISLHHAHSLSTRLFGGML
jgi:hypothetical protein